MSESQQPNRSATFTAVLSRALAALLVLALWGCSAQAPEGLIPPELLSQMLELEELQGRVVVAWQIDDGMRAWAEERVSDSMPAEAKLERLVKELLDNRVLPLQYTRETTGTAIEVFETRQANCLAFTNLFVGMARELGVPVFFLAVEDVATYRREGDLVVISDHIAVGFERGLDIKMYDFSEHGMQEHTKIRRISDLTALAMFHSNRGVEALRDGDLEGATGWLRTAATLDPGLANAWVNLGVVLRRAGDLAAAEAAYRQAIELDPRLPSPYQNLAALLRHLGREDEARELEDVLARAPNRNPFTYLALGDVSRERGHLDEARRLYKRAANLSEGDGEPWAALGELALASGDRRQALKMLRKARKVEPDDPRALRLAEELGASR